MVAAGHRRIIRLPFALMLAVTMFLGLLGLSNVDAAAQGAIVTRDTTINALADGVLCTVGEDGTETCSTIHIHVSPDKSGESLIVCLQVTTGEVFEEGCADVAATFTMDTEDLAWAELAPTGVDLYVNVCDPGSKECDFQFSRTVTLAATWTAAGERIPIHELQGNPSGPCPDFIVIDGFVRDAVVGGTLDGAGFEATGELQVIHSTSVRVTGCG